MIVKPDMITVHPKNCDYPLWRQQIRNSREHFKDIIVVFMNPNHGFDYSPFVREAMMQDNVRFFDSPPVISGQDWRNVATRFALEHSHAKWVWFTEQDFFTTRQFWLEVNQYVKEQYPVIAIQEGDRIHPASILAKREVIDKTRKNFSVVPNHDHFYSFVMDLKDKVGEIKIVKGGYEHMNGLSHNMTLLQRGENVTYKPEELRKYFEKCLSAKVQMHDNFIQLAEGFLSNYTHNMR